MIIDTHCHLHFEQFDADREEVLKRALGAGVKMLINVGTDPENNEKAWALASRYPLMRHTAGLHPHSANLVTEEMFLRIERHVKEKKPVAVGEIGLDYFKSEAEPAIQKIVFARMLAIALQNDLPVVVHSRNAFQDTFEMLRSEGKGRLRGVMHCYSYDAASLKKLADIGFLASFTCNLTYKNAGPFLEAAIHAPLGQMMLETDSPYLSPQTHRGQRNEPSHLPALVRFLAEKKGVSEDVLMNETSRNAIRFFGLPEFS